MEEVKYAAPCDPRMRFLVDYWVSYNATGLTAADANASSARRLTQRELNRCETSDGSPLTVIDLAVGRWLVVQPTVTASGVGTVLVKSLPRMFFSVWP
jgi:hypothetical protein